MIRKVIQFSAAARPDGGDADVYALCNDGTLWQLVTGHWQEMPAIPQDESKDPLAKLYAKNVDMSDKLVDARQRLDAIQIRADGYAASRHTTISEIGRELTAIIEHA